MNWVTQTVRYHTCRWITSLWLVTQSFDKKSQQMVGHWLTMHKTNFPTAKRNSNRLIVLRCICNDGVHHIVRNFECVTSSRHGFHCSRNFWISYSPSIWRLQTNTCLVWCLTDARFVWASFCKASTRDQIKSITRRLPICWLFTVSLQVLIDTLGIIVLCLIMMWLLWLKGHTSTRPNPRRLH